MTPAIRELFERINEGLAIVASDGRVRFANTAMTNMLPVVPDQIFPHEVIARSLDSATNGHLPLPHSMRIEIRYDSALLEPDQAQTHILKSPAGNDLLVLIHNLTEAAFYETTLANLAGLIDHQCRAPLEQFDQALGNLLEDLEYGIASASDLNTVRQTVVSMGRQLCDQLSLLARFAELGRSKPIDAEDRIVAHDWLTELVSGFQPAAHERGQRLQLKLPDAMGPVIYGSRHWLGLAVSACLDNAIRHSPERSDISITMRNGGGFMQIIICNSGMGQVLPSVSKRLCMPLFRGKNAFEAEQIGLGLGLPLARHIAERHRGHLCLREGIDGLFTCTLELPTGGSLRETPIQDLEQAQRFARDLARLLEQQTQRTAPPNPSDPK